MNASIILSERQKKNGRPIKREYAAIPRMEAGAGTGK